MQALENGEDSTVTLGGFPHEMIEGSTFTLPTTEHFLFDSWWTVKLNKVSFGDYSKSGDFFAVIDTGNPAIILGLKDYFAFVDKIENIGGKNRWWNC